MKIEKFITSLQKVFEEKTILIFWNTLLFSGGVVFLSYFMHIQFVPELELKSVVLLFASGSIIAGVIIFFLCLLLIVPGIMWDSAISSSEFFTKLKEKSEKEYIKQIIYWFGIPSLLLVFCLHLYFFKNKVAFIAFASFSTIGYITALIRFNKSSPWYTLVVSWVLGSSFLFIPLVILYTMANNAALQNNIQDWIKISLSMLFIVISNTCILLKPTKQKRVIWLAVVSLFSLAYVTLVIGCWSFIPQLIFSNAKLGNIVEANLIMSSDGCDIFELYKLHVDHIKKNGICSTKSPVTILSRIGNNYYIEARRNENELIRFTLPPDTVKSWSTVEATSGNIIKK